MRVRYSLDRFCFSQNPHVCLSSEGSFFLSGLVHNTSAYHGLSFLSDELVPQKCIHAFVPQNRFSHARINPSRVQRLTLDSCEESFFSQGMFCARLRNVSPTKILLDGRRLDDFSQEGRFHSIELISASPWIYRISSSGGVFILASSVQLDIIDNWVSVDVSFDTRRNDRRGWWVHERFSIPSCPEARIVCSPEKQFSSSIFFSSVWTEKLILSRNPEKEFLSASLKGLTLSSRPAILAGFPWFTQVWARDEAISVGGLLAQKEFFLAKNILLRQLSSLLPSGFLANRYPESSVGSADGVGWCIVRLQQLFSNAVDVFSHSDLLFVHTQLQSIVQQLFATRFTDGHIINYSQETWMDTLGGVNDTRSGVRIEIQALTLAILSFGIQVSSHLQKDDSCFTKHYSSLLQNTRSLKKGAILSDGLKDTTVRPNIALAAYVFPQLFTQAEWEEVFDAAIQKLYLPWGALSTIQKDHSWYQEMHSGISDSSYHRGDTWFWVNNLFALVLQRVNEQKYEKVISRILDASLYDLFSGGGCLGACSEISSARQYEPLGCWSQAWSAATLLELLVSFE